MRSIFLLIALVVGFVSSCSDDEVLLEPEKLGQQYYPLEVGTYRIYGVTEVDYSNNVVTNNEAYQIKESITSITKDQTGKEWYEVEVSRKAYEASSWTPQEIKLISKTSTALEVQENNRTVVQMVFPIKNGDSWVYNAYFDQSTPARYSYDNLGESFEVDGTTYPTTVKVIKGKSAPGDILNLYDHYEVLAADKGPVYRFYKYHTYCDDSTGERCPYGVGYIVSGTERIEVLEEMGNIE